MRRLLIGLPLLLLGGCLPAARVQVLQPAELSLPAHVRTLTVLDRSRPSNTGQGVAGTIEGLVTGEALFADRDGGRAAVAGLAETLSASPRFEVVVPAFDRKKQQSNLFDHELSWDRVRAICQQSKAQALVSLEAFDSDSYVTDDSYTRTDTDDNGREVQRVVYTAQRETQVVVGWRVYDAANEVLLDDLRAYPWTDSWQEEGDSRSEARSNLPAQHAAVVGMGRDAGVRYGMRIAPSYVWVQRTYYGGGNDKLSQAKRFAKIGDWEGAEALWRQVADNAPDPKNKARALFNLALAAEVGGELEAAKDLAKQAAVASGKGRDRRYLAALKQRLRDQARVDVQMAPVRPAGQ